MPHKRVRGEPSETQIRLCNGIRRGDVLRVDLRGAKGTELAGPHFCVVVSNDVLNAQERTVVIVPLSTHGGSGKPKAFEVALKAGQGDLEKDGAAIPHQVRTIHSLERVIEIWGRLGDDTMDEIEEMLIWAISRSLTP